MKCPSCGKTFPGFSDKCPYCGIQTYFTSEYRNKTAEFLAKPFKLGNMSLTNLNIIFLVVINISILAFIANGITYYACHLPGVWCQYIICIALAVYVFLKGFLANKLQSLRYVRRAVYIILLSLCVAELAYRNRFSYLISAYSVLLILLGIICFAFLITKRASHGSFGLTTFLNTLLSIIPLVIIRYTTVELSSFGVFMSYAAFGFSALTLINYILIWLIPLTTRFKNSF